MSNLTEVYNKLRLSYEVTPRPQVWIDGTVGTRWTWQVSKESGEKVTGGIASTARGAHRQARRVIKQIAQHGGKHDVTITRAS